MPSLVEVLERRAEETPGRLAYTFLADGETEAELLTFGGLAAAARAVAARLRRRGGEGERALLLFPPGLAFLPAFLGCLLAGVIAVPAYPPRPRRGADRAAAILEDAAPRFALTTAALAVRLEGQLAASPAGAALEWLATDALSASAERGNPQPPVPDTVAFLQYTSGSTGDPKGVVVTHGNLAADEEAIRRAFGQSEESVVVGWLPLHHDMGLIGNLLQPLWCGGRAVLMAPLAFLQRPRRWLEAIGRYRGTTAGGPDFAYSLCVRKIPPGERRGLDLSSWRLAFNGAEPVRAETLDRFTEAFAPCGFRRQAFYPCYGLAEATLFVTGGRPEAPPVVRPFDAAALEEHRAIPPRGDGDARSLVSSGRAWPGEEVAVADPKRRTPRAPGEVGEIWLRGPSVARGYWQKPEESRALFAARLAGGAGPYLRTGDLGFLDTDGELFVTGRLKDLMILRGRNVYPQDVEATAAGSHPALAPQGAAAFSLEEEGEERLVVVCEVDRRREAEAAAALEAARRRVVEEHEVLPRQVVGLRAGTLPRTTSGKVRRAVCRQQWLAGELTRVEAVPRAVPNGAEGQTEKRWEGQSEGIEARVAGLAARVTESDPAALDRRVPLALDSLQAVELRHRLEAELGAAPPLERLLGGMSPAEVAAAVARSDGPRVEILDDLGPMDGMDVGPEDAPVTPGQRALWLFQRMAPQSSAYHVAFAARLRRAGGGVPGAGELHRAFQRLAARHPALVGTYPAEAGEPVGRPGDPRSFDFAAVSAAGWSGERLTAWLAEAAAEPFDLEHGPVARARLLLPGGEVGEGREAPVLLFAAHHIAADFRSLAVLVEELGVQLGGSGRASGSRPEGDVGAELASARVGANPDPAQEGEGELRPYEESEGAGAQARPAEHARRRQRWPAGPEEERSWPYWQQQLADLPAPLELPADRPRPPVASWHGAVRQFRLDDALAASARSLARRFGTTVFTVLLAGFQTLTHRLTGRRDFVTGTPAAGRDPSQARAVGFFANLLPLRADLAGRPSFAEVVDRARGTVAGALEHQGFPFPLLVERLQPVPDPSRPPLAPVGFVVETLRGGTGNAGEDGAGFALGTAGAVVRSGGLLLEAVPVERRAVPFDWILELADDGAALAGAVHYATDLFDETTVLRRIGEYRTLLAAAVAEPECPVAALPLLTRAETQQVLREWSGTAAAAPAVEPDIEPGGGLLHELFASWARAQPDAVALTWGGEVSGREGLRTEGAWTYGELAGRANRLARRLRAAGVGAEVPVALHLPRSPELVAAMLAVLEAGGAYLPLDPELPPQRLETLLADSGAPVAVSRADRVEGLPPGPRVLLMEDEDNGDDESGEAAEASPAHPAALPESLAYVLYTSGSTGGPKGVGVPHRAVAHLMAVTRERCRLGPGHRVLQLASPGFDASVLEIFMALTTGAALHLAPPAARLSGGELAEELRRRGITHAVLVPSLLRRTPETDLPALEAVIAGGEVLPGSAAARWAAACRLDNGYGPTEATVYVSLHRCSPAEEAPTIGRPIPGLRLHIIDGNLEPLPPGVAGELAIGGAGLARGYLGRPALTAAAFVPDPFAETPGERLYRSGDRARWRSDGRLEFLGRLDQQIKVRGLRIEPGEVAEALERHPRVREAAVAARQDRLVAYVVAEDAAETGGVEGADLRRFLARSLPEYMLPSEVVVLAELPRTSRGKLDRRALPAPRPAPGSGTAPRSELERTLAAVCCEVLAREEVGVETSLFELGAHSLQMARIQARLAETLGREIPLTDLFSHPTVASLAQHLADSPGPREAEAAATAARRRAAGRRERLRRQRQRRREGNS